MLEKLPYFKRLLFSTDAEKRLRESEEYYRSLLENASDIIVVLDMAGHYQYVTPSFERFLGWSTAEVLGRSFALFLHPEDLPGVTEQVQIAFSRPGFSLPPYEFRAKHKNGAWRILESVGTARNGLLIVNARDITDRKQAETRLRESEEYFRSLIENATDAIAVTTPEGELAYVSPSYERIWGWRADELLGQPFLPLIHPDDVAHAGENIMNLMTIPGYIGSTEIRVRHKDGSWRTIEGKGKRLPDGNIVSNVRDVTQRRNLENELRQLNAELEQRVEERTAALQTALMESRRLAAIIEAMPDYVGIATLDGISLYVNQAGRKMVGKPLKEETQAETPWNVANCYPADELPNLQGMFAAMQRGDSWAGEALLQHLDGHRIPADHIIFPLRTPDGQIESYAAVIRDITERKRAEEELRHAKEAAETALADSKRLTAILEATPDLVAMADLQGNAIYLNRAGRRFYGLNDEDEVSTLDFSTAYPPEVSEKMFNEYLPYALQHEGVWHGESRLLLPDGSQLPVSQVGIIHFGAQGQPERLSTIVRDISEQKQVQAELQTAKEVADEARAAAEAANRAKSTFLANMSHEIRTPMNAVIGMTGLLLNTPLQEKQRDFVETIRTSGDALLTIINDILDFSKIEAGKMELVQRPLDLRACLESSLDLLAPRAEEKGLELAYVMEDEVPSGILGDDTRLRQILVNLIGNAIKFTERGEVVVTVSRVSEAGATISLTPDQLPLDTLHFAVQDTGLGIPSDKLGRLFHSFSQLDSSATREYGGTGLGLAISKRLAELMGGTMWAESNGQGQGSTFHFTIQAQPAPAPIRSHLHSPQPLLVGKRVLIVDDNPTNRRILMLQTQTWGMESLEAALPSEALALLDQGQGFDLAILDMHLPEMDGASLAAAMCDVHVRLGHHFPLVLLTSLGYETRPELDEVMCFSAYLTKPVKPSQLYDVLVSVLVDEEREARRAQALEHHPELPLTHLAENLPLRILLAEDVVVNQKFALLALNEMGYSADVAANGLEVLEALKRQAYDVILMDVQMPELDGLDATRRIRAGFALDRQPRIVAMTANAMQGDRELCLEAGMDDYISKPVYLEELQAALERAGQWLKNKRKEEMSTPTQSLPEAEAPLLDVDAFKKILRYPKSRDLITAYLEEAEALVGAIQWGVSTGDARVIRDRAHALKGSSSYLGAQRVQALSAAMELAGKQGTTAHTPELLARLLEAHSHTCALLMEYQSIP